MTKYSFSILILLTVLFGNLASKVLGLEELFFNSLAGYVSHDQIMEILKSQQRWWWLGYITMPFLILIKVATIAAILDAGCFFFDREIKYGKLFSILIKAEFVFLLVIVFKTLWFYVFQQDYTLEDIQYFYPLSALNIVGYEGVKPWFIYPLQVLNVFEIIYWGILAYLLGKELNISTGKGMGIVASSYGVGLVIWVVAVMFFTLNMS